MGGGGAYCGVDINGEPYEITLVIISIQGLQSFDSHTRTGQGTSTVESKVKCYPESPIPLNKGIYLKL